MPKLIGLIICLIVGLMFLIGILITNKIHNKDKLNKISIGLSFIIMLGLIIFDLIPDLLEYNYKYKYIIIMIFSILGLLFLKILDLFIPNHHHEHRDNESNKLEHTHHLEHISKITLFSLILHNIVEGSLIYSMCLNNLKSGILIGLSVLLHNIPLGINIFNSIKIKDNKLLIASLVLSSFMGGLILFLVNNISNIVFSIITSITLGMLIYITIFELLKEIITYYKDKEIYIGLGIGLILVIITNLI